MTDTEAGLLFMILLAWLSRAPRTKGYELDREVERLKEQNRDLRRELSYVNYKLDKLKERFRER